MAELYSFPNNSDEYIGAEEVMRWLHGRTSGVFANRQGSIVGNAAVTPVAGTMKVSVSAGTGWITDLKENGIVWWFDEAQELTLDQAEGSKDRIDRIVIEWKTTDYADLPELKVEKGTAVGSNPVPPALKRTDSVYQISLARVSVARGTTTLTAAMITDERQDLSACGIVTESVAADTSVIQSQFAALLSSVEEELAELEADTAVELKKKQFINKTVAPSAFVNGSSYGDYPYYADVACEGVIASMIPEVVFGLDDAISGLFAPVTETGNGYVRIYASDIPESTITIPTIICWRGDET